MFLNVHSSYSLRYGTMSVEQLVKEAVALGIEQMAITDINNSTGVMEFMRECRAHGIRPIGGIEFRKQNKLLYIGIARNKEGMKELNDFLTFHNLSKKELPDRAEVFKNACVIYPYQSGIEVGTDDFIGIRPTQLNLLYGRDMSQLRDKLVVWQPVTVYNRLHYRLHEYLRAIELNTLLTKVDEGDKCRSDEHFLPPGELKHLYAAYPFILENTEKLMAACTLNYVNKERRNKRTYKGSKAEDQLLLEQLAWAGLEQRYKGEEKHKAEERLKKELKVIDELDFFAYFLITWDIIRYGKSKGYYHVGRGSGANSIVAYCLFITDVDPIELDLYFERFLNKNRSSPPDFDIDYSWDEREDIQQYIFDTYGEKHTAMLGTMSSFKDRSVFREIGKVMGLPKAEIDDFLDPVKQEEHKKNPVYKKIMAAYGMMEKMPNQRSIHAGGILISEDPITYYTALDLPPKDFATVQWDMYEAEAIGLDKFDILSQRGIGHIKEAVQLIRQNTGDVVDIHDTRNLLKDPRLNGLLKEGNSIGCFYIESPAMRQLLIKLACEDYLTLVAASSIIRPGVAQSGMMTTYIYNYHHPEEVKYLHPIMEEHLKDTYGVMVYQEDVIKICYHYGGLDLADADILRRGMSGKYRSKKEFDRLVESFFIHAKKEGRDEEVTKEIWRQVASFAGYSFSKAHSASYAVESYQSLFLKTYYPKEFMVAVLNNYGGFYQRWVYVHELRRVGAIVHLPCVNHSEDVVSINGSDAYLGLIGIQGLESRYMTLIPKERKSNGLYKGLEDFVRRTGITLEQAILLIRIGALRFTGFSKKALLWEVYSYLGTKQREVSSQELFGIESKPCMLPPLDSNKLEDAYNELELLGYPVSMEMFDLLKTDYRGDVKASGLKAYIGQTIKMVGLYVCEKTVHTKNNKKMWFGTFLDAEGNFFDTTHFSTHTPVYPFRGKGCYLILGKVAADFGFPSIEVLRFAKLPLVDNPVMA